MDKHYMVLVAAEHLIPATAEFTGKSELEIRKIWDTAQKNKNLCTFRVDGDLPPFKRCAYCNTLARANAEECKTCGDRYSK